MSQEKRKHPRFDTNLDVIFYDQKRTRGKIVNISKKGCMLVIDRGTVRPIGSMITFRVFFEGKAQLLESTTPSISLRKVDMDEDYVPQSDVDMYPHSVKILAKVARHVEHNEKPAMGIQLLELEEKDLQKWSDFLKKKNIEQVVMPYMGADESTMVKLKPKLITYAIQFKSIALATNYFPKKPDGYFFIPSKPVPENTVIKIVMTHPENKSQIEFNAIVVAYGASAKNKEVNGILVKYENLTEDLKAQIHLFTNQLIYP